MILMLMLLFSEPARSEIHVPVVFIEALSPRDSTSSEKFKKDFETSVAAGIKLNRAKLKSCGYALTPSFRFYDASEALQAKEIATKGELTTWLFVGPRRSNHYIAMVKGSEVTPSISLMAGSSEVEKLGPLHTTLSPYNGELANASAREAYKRSSKSKTYVSIVSRDCLTCVDFAEKFNTEAKTLGLKILEDFQVSGENPDISSNLAKINSLNPDFILLPNFSKASATVMNTIGPDFKGFYVGSDGWGDSKFGFVQKSTQLDQIAGFTVRGFPPVRNGLAAFPLGAEMIKKDSVKLPESGPAMAALKVLDWTGSLLCEDKPNSKITFKNSFLKYSHTLKAPWGVSVYNLKAGEITYSGKFQTRK